MRTLPDAHVVTQLTHRDRGRPPIIVGGGVPPRKIKDALPRTIYEGIVGSPHNNDGAYAYHRSALTRWLREQGLGAYESTIPYFVAEMVTGGLLVLDVVEKGMIWLTPTTTVKARRDAEKRSAEEPLIQEALAVWNATKHRNQPAVRLSAALSEVRRYNLRLTLALLADDLRLWRHAVMAFANSPHHNGTGRDAKAWGIDTMVRPAHREKWIDAALVAQEEAEKYDLTYERNPIAVAMARAMA